MAITRAKSVKILSCPTQERHDFAKTSNPAVKTERRFYTLWEDITNTLLWSVRRNCTLVLVNFSARVVAQTQIKGRAKVPRQKENLLLSGDFDFLV